MDDHDEEIAEAVAARLRGNGNLCYEIVTNYPGMTLHLIGMEMRADKHGVFHTDSLTVAEQIYRVTKKARGSSKMRTREPH